MFCIDFEDDDLVGQGAYQPWVLNEDVTVVTSADCPQGSRCGYFNGSRLEIPFFSNAYSSFPGLWVEFWYKRTGSEPANQGLISNDCFQGQTYEPGNSLYASCTSSDVETGLKSISLAVAHAKVSKYWIKFHCDDFFYYEMYRVRFHVILFQFFFPFLHVLVF